MLLLTTLYRQIPLPFKITPSVAGFASSVKPSRIRKGKEGEGREAKEEGNIRLTTVDSHCCMTETNTTLQSNFSLITNKLKEKKKNKKGEGKRTPLKDTS